MEKDRREREREKEEKREKNIKKNKVALARMGLGVATRELEELRESRDDGLVIQKFIISQATGNLQKQEQIVKMTRAKEKEVAELKNALQDREREASSDQE